MSQIECFSNSANPHIAPISTAISTGKEPHPSVVPKNGQNSAAVKNELHTVNASAADNVFPKKDETAGTKSIVIAVPEKTPARKSNNRKKKFGSVSKLPDAIPEKFLEVSDVATPSVVGASRKPGTNKKKEPSANTAEPIDGNSSKQLKTNGQTNGTKLSLPVANKASTAPVKKKKKSKSRLPRDTVNDTEKVADEIEKNTFPPSRVVNGVNQPIVESDIQDPSNRATTADTLDATPADLDRKSLEDELPVQCTHISTGTSEAAPAPSLSFIEAPMLALSHSESTRELPQAVQDVIVPRTRSVMARKRRTQNDVEKYVASLDLPGISFDEFGVCIAPDAPKWVRGRIARRVQCLVWDFKAGKTPAEVDIATELELEKKEKAHFHKELWDYLYMIDDREPTSDTEYRYLSVMLRDFDVKLAAGLIPDFTFTQAGDEVGEEEFLDNIDDELSLSLPMQVAESRSSFHEQSNIQQDRGNTDVQVPPPNLRLRSQIPLTPEPAISGPQSSVKITTNDNPYLGSSIPNPSPPQEYNQAPWQQHQQMSRRPCYNYASGFCYYGADCHFVHADPDDNQAVAEPYRQDSEYAVFDSSRSVSRSSNGTGMAGPLDARSNGQGQLSRTPSRMSGNTNPNARLTPDLYGSAQSSAQGPSGGYRPNHGPLKKKKKGGAKHKVGKKPQAVNH